MIGKQDILDRAAEWRLRPEIVEKDYVLGWLLGGVASLPLREHWIFKGGTSIKTLAQSFVARTRKDSCGLWKVDGSLVFQRLGCL